MGRPILLALSLAAALASVAAAGEPYAPPPSLVDATTGVRISVENDGRTVVQVNKTGGILGVFDPLSGGDAGKAGTIVSFRFATSPESGNFPSHHQGRLFVLTYSSGGVVVMDNSGGIPLEPANCGKSNADIVRLNIACRLDLEKAAQVRIDATIASHLGPGPPMADYRRPADFRVPGSDIVLHVAANGRTVSAVEKSGRQLWSEDPFEAGRLKPYRVVRPVISSIAETTSWGEPACHDQTPPFAVLTYNSSQFGCLDARTGRFQLRGRN